MTGVTESVVEQATLAWLEAMGWQVAHGPDIAPDMLAPERRDYGEVVLAQRLPGSTRRSRRRRWKTPSANSRDQKART
jgi:type I restriction enzyme R subunit